MSKINRREERKQALYLLFETVFRSDETPAHIYSIAVDEKQLPESNYIKTVYFGTTEHIEEIDEVINSHAKGRTASQMTIITRSILRLAVYEIMYMPDIPAKISINEAVELTKEFEEEKVKGFVNGILNSIYKDSEASNEVNA